LVHDYLYNIAITVGNKENYNDKNELFVTDIKSFSKGLNPNLNYSRQFINYFYDNFNDTTHSNFYFKYKEQYVIFQNDYRPLTSKSIAEIIEKSKEISFSLD
jgi:hypothetical protein